MSFVACSRTPPCRRLTRKPFDERRYNMAKAPTIIWPGLSSKEYKYWIYPIGASFKEEPGNYIFAKETKPGSWLPCYIGQTENLSQRLGDHEKEACAKRGNTCSRPFEFWR